MSDTRTHPWTDDELLRIDGRPHVYETRHGEVYWIRMYGGARRYAEALAMDAADRDIAIRWPRRVRP